MIDTRHRTITVQCSAVQCSAVQCSAAFASMVRLDEHNEELGLCCNCTGFAAVVEVVRMLPQISIESIKGHTAQLIRANGRFGRKYLMRSTHRVEMRWRRRNCSCLERTKGAISNHVWQLKTRDMHDT
eukprot:COSAG02_NODE_24316_length_692_cov_0.868465_1_plen_128_part_00